MASGSLQRIKGTERSYGSIYFFQIFLKILHLTAIKVLFLRKHCPDNLRQFSSCGNNRVLHLFFQCKNIVFLKQNVLHPLKLCGLHRKKHLALFQKKHYVSQYFQSFYFHPIQKLYVFIICTNQ